MPRPCSLGERGVCLGFDFLSGRGFYPGAVESNQGSFGSGLLEFAVVGEW